MAANHESTKLVFKLIKEGKAQLKVPQTVFYNPVQEFNRDLSVLIVRTFLKHNVWHHKKEEMFVKSRGGLNILDALSASGLRSIRYAKELGQAGNIVKKIIANDLSTVAVDLIKENIELNNVQDKVQSSLSDAAMLLYKSSVGFDDKFHIVDIDPFGTAAPFINASIAGIADGGLLMVTCTDAAVLCGNASESCFARYGSMSLRGEFCHEQAIRIILRSLESHAALQGKYIQPLVSLSIDFYLRVFVRVFTQQAETKKSASKLSLVYCCKGCKTTEFQPLGVHQIKEDPKQAESKNPAVKFKFHPGTVKVGEKCHICGSSYLLGGPIWSDPIHDKNFLNLLRSELELPETKEDFQTFKRIRGMIQMCIDELPTPLLYSLDTISSVLRVTMIPSKDLKSAIVNAGYSISDTHTNKNGFKTDAPSSVVWDIFCQWARRRQLRVKDPLAQRILDRKTDKVYNFTYNPAIESESVKLSLLRFQTNPTKGWGPKARPVVSQAVAPAAAAVPTHDKSPSNSHL